MAAFDELMRLLALHCQRLNGRDKRSVGELWVDHGTLQVTGGGQSVSGRDEVIAAMTDLMDPLVAQRIFTVNPILEVDGDRARGWSDFFVLSKHHAGGRVTSIGRYVDGFVRTSSGWKFASRAVVTGEYEPSTGDRFAAGHGSDENGVRLTLAQYNQFLKDRRLDDLTNLWLEDGIFIALGIRYEGRPAIREFLAANAMPSIQNLAGGGHFVTNSIIEIDGDRAMCSSDMFTIFHSPDGPVMRGSVGRYLDKMQRSGDRWLFQERRNVTSQWP